MTQGSLRIVSQAAAPPVELSSPPLGGGFDGGLRSAFVTSPATSRLGEPGAIAVTTGQQPGLFGGALYTVHKALAARALAARLEQRWGRPVVPVFWLAGDDHDWTEAAETAWWSLDGDALAQWALPARPDDAPQLPMSRELLPSDVVGAREALAAALPAGPDRDRTITWLERHWQPGVPMADAFGASLAELLGPWGIACLDATAEPVKQAQRPIIAAALDRALDLDRALADLPDAGTGIAAGDGATLVFLEGSAGRDRLVVDGDEFVTRRGGERFTTSDLHHLLAHEPGRFSANVLLRPVVEAAILPTVAYLAGPGEHRYLSRQAAHLYPLLGVAPQRPVPRWGGTVVDAVASRLLGRLSLSAEAVLGDDGTIGRGVLRRDLPAAVPPALERLRTAIAESAAVLTRDGEGIDPVLTRAIESRRRRLASTADDLERLLERHLKKRDDIAYRQYRRLRTRLMPLDSPQERVLGVAGALGRWGDRWLEAAATAATRWAAGALVAEQGDS